MTAIIISRNIIKFHIQHSQQNSFLSLLSSLTLLTSMFSSQKLNSHGIRSVTYWSDDNIIPIIDNLSTFSGSSGTDVDSHDHHHVMLHVVDAFVSLHFVNKTYRILFNNSNFATLILRSRIQWVAYKMGHIFASDRKRRVLDGKRHWKNV